MSTQVNVRPTTMNSTHDTHHDRFYATTRSYGITSPILTSFPAPADRVATENLEETLRSYDYFESDAELAHRMDILAKLNDLVRIWIRDVSLAKNLPPEIVESVGGRVHTFGSYRLGVHSKGGDIDTLLIAPRHIHRADFFSSFVEFLRRQPEVCDLRSIEQAFVPLIKLKFDGIELDMLFARLATATIPDALDLKDDRILLNLDPSCVRSLNGCRVTDEILDLVPNHETFKSTLRAIKLWAKKSGLYSNALGFLGGVTWAMLVARICQLYPNAVAATLVHKFFFVYSKWEWPTPVLLKQVNDAEYGFPVWDAAVNHHDRHHLMPVITPAYPQQNSTHNVSQSTRKIIIEEIKRSFDIVTKIMSGKAEWKELFTGVPFFDRYKHYIILSLTATDQNQFLEWSGLVEAKIRLLTGNLERNRLIELAHVNLDKYTPDQSMSEQKSQAKETLVSETPTEANPSNGGNSESSSTNGTQASAQSPSDTADSRQIFGDLWVIGLEFKDVKEIKLDLTDEIRNFLNLVYQAAGKKNTNRENINLDVRYMRQRDLRTVLPKHILLTINFGSRASKTNPVDQQPAPPLKRTKSGSTSSDSGIIADSDAEPKAKRERIE